MTGDINRFLVLTVRNILHSIKYYRNRCRLFPKNIQRIVFVCSGNICRSAFADYLLKSKLKGKMISIDSCGLNVEVSSPPPQEALRVSRNFRVNMSGHFSKGCDSCDLENADLILAMEFWQYRKLVQYYPHKKGNILLLRELTPFPGNLFCNINDPYGRREKDFAKCFRQISRAIAGINNLI